MPKLGYNFEEGKITYSHSLSELFHSCPRKFQIQAINGHGEQEYSPTFSLGHATAAGIQAILSGATFNQVVLEMLLNWNVRLWETDYKKRSIDMAWTAIQKFYLYQDMVLSGWEVAWFIDQHGNKRSGVEFDFKLIFPDGSSYQGHVDCILYNPEKKEFRVLELKTTSQYHESSYRNKGQTLGYSLIVDYILSSMQEMINLSPEEIEKIQSNTQVLYLVYDIKMECFETLPLSHSRLAKAEFLQTITLDILQIKNYQEINFFPKNGASCRSFNKDCKFFGTCDLFSLRKPRATEDHTVFTVQGEDEIAMVISIADLMTQQLSDIQDENFSPDGDSFFVPTLTIDE